MTADPVDRMVEILRGFPVHGADDGSVWIEHPPCRTWFPTSDPLTVASLVIDAIMHAGDCPGPHPPQEQPEPKPCGAAHTGMCEEISREPTDNGVWITYRHPDGEGRAFHGAQ